MLFRLTGTVEHDAAVAAYFDAAHPHLVALGRSWYERVRHCAPDVHEILHDGLITLCVEGAAFAYVGLYTSHVSVGFFRGARLPDPAGLLEGTGKSMRHVKLRPGVAIDEEALMALVVEAYGDVVRALGSESPRNHFT